MSLCRFYYNFLTSFDYHNINFVLWQGPLCTGDECNGIKGDEGERGDIDAMQRSAINGQPPTQRLAPKHKTSHRLGPN